MFNIEQIRELIQLMMDNDIAEVSIKSGDDEVALKRRGAATEIQMVAAAAPYFPASAFPGAPAPAAVAPGGTEKSQDEGLVPIKSPMVGTFYAAPDPSAPPYVTVGSAVTEDTVVCIIEAMKVFNEIKAEVRGIIERVLVSNEAGVDYGQPLFLVRPG